MKKMSTGLRFNFGLPDKWKEELTPNLIKIIDEAIGQDFDEVCQISDEDRKNDMYKAIKFALDAAHIKILYNRKVITENKEPVIPYAQFIFGFKHADGLCIFTQKRHHKEMLCDGPLQEVAKKCVLTQSLQYILVESKSFKVWSFIPICCSNSDSCGVKKNPLHLRRNLFEDD
jgi:hypothetical protein